MEYPTYLIHYGTLGQKWGVRKYQNEDGTWTEEGLRRRREASEQIYRDLKKEEKQYFKNRDRSLHLNSRLGPSYDSKKVNGEFYDPAYQKYYNKARNVENNEFVKNLSEDKKLLKSFKPIKQMSKKLDVDTNIKNATSEDIEVAKKRFLTFNDHEYDENNEEERPYFEASIRRAMKIRQGYYDTISKIIDDADSDSFKNMVNKYNSELDRVAKDFVGKHANDPIKEYSEKARSANTYKELIKVAVNNILMNKYKIHETVYTHVLSDTYGSSKYSSDQKYYKPIKKTI